MTVIACPSFLVAKALTRLDTLYRLLERDRNSAAPALRSLAIAAKTYGIVFHDQALAGDQR